MLCSLRAFELYEEHGLHVHMVTITSDQITFSHVLARGLNSSKNYPGHANTHWGKIRRHGAPGKR